MPNHQKVNILINKYFLNGLKLRIYTDLVYQNLIVYF